LRSATLCRGSTGKSRRPKVAGYGLQLREKKQKVKRSYGLLERQFRNYFEKAARAKGPTGENLIIMLERRLDNVVWRAGLASSRSQARQLVLHGHVRVNGKKVNIPSYLVNVGEEIAIKEKNAPERHGARSSQRLHRARALYLGSNRSANTSRPRSWLCRSATTCRRRRSTSSSSSNCIRSKSHKGAASASELGDPGTVFGFRSGHSGQKEGTRCGRVFQKPKRLASELESLTEKYGRFFRAAF